MRKTLLGIFFLVTIINLYSQPPQGYYDSANGLNGQALKTALHNIIKNHAIVSYSALYTAFPSTDNKGNNMVWDIYSDIPFGNPPYTYYYTNPSDQCGQYSSEGDCFNREHSWPQSWFNSTGIPIYSDLFNVYPTDGWVNNKRGNLPYGKVNNPSWTSLNGSKIGPCVSPGYNGSVFEPINEYKGDVARSYFYITVRYMGQDSSWPGSDQTIGADLKPWAYDLMYSWHKLDPVSQKETDRNDAIFLFQNNRNPFIDNPDWVDSIMFPLGIIKDFDNNFVVSISPNPTSDLIYISSFLEIDELSVYDMLGNRIDVFNLNCREQSLDISFLKNACYIFVIRAGDKIYHKKILKH